MSEQQLGSSGVDHEANQGPDGPDTGEITAGTYLRESREAAGLHLATLAASLKVSVGKLEALEHDQFDLLPGAVFTRALASSVCRMLKLDPVPVLNRLPPVVAAKFVSQDRGINEPFRHRNAGQASSAFSQISRPAVLAGLVLLLGALVLIFLPSILNETPLGNLLISRDVASKPALQPLPSALATAALEDTAATELLTGAPTDQVGPGVRESVPPAEEGPSVPEVVLANGGEAAASSLPVATFHATGESWVKVSDAKGAVVLNRTLKAGEAAEVSGVLPLSAVVGRVDVTQVQVRGQPFDLNAVSKNNIARFEVK